MSNLKNTVNPLTWSVPIVNPKDGTPTDEFMRKWAQQAGTNGSIPNLTTAAGLSAFLDLIGLAQGDILYRDATQWKVLAPGTLGYILTAGGAAANPAWESISAALDGIGSTQGDILYRGASAWQVLAPGTDGQTLLYDGTAHAPKWASDGVGVILGTGAPASAQPAGTLYSRTDTAAVYSSQPTLAAPSIVQSSKQDNNSVGSPKSIIFASAVTTGNLLVAILSDATVTIATAAAGWTLQSSVTEPTGISSMAIYTRTAQAGDGTTPPAVVTNGAGGSSGWINFELSGTDWTHLDGAVVTAGVNAPGASTVMSAYTPTVSSDLVLTAVADFKAVFANQPTIGAPFTVDQQGAFFRMAEWGGHDSAPAGGTPIAATITWGASSVTGVYMVFGLQGTALVANWVQVGGTFPVGANPSATASDTAVNGAANTFMRSDAAPAVQKGSSSAFGLVKVDNTTITASGGVISAVAPTVPTGANPTATASATAVNGSATTFMRSDGAPAIQKASSSQFGIIEVDGTTITASSGVISAVAPTVPTGANPTATASDTAVNGTATTFMRSDAAPAVQKVSSSVFGLAKVDNKTIVAAAGIISAQLAPVFQAILFGSSQSITAASYTKVLLDTVIIDSGSYWDATNYRYTPQIAGTYMVSGGVETIISGALSLTLSFATIQKNGKPGTGVTYSKSLLQVPASVNNMSMTLPIGFATMNGTTDYLELWGRADSTGGTTPAIGNDQNTVLSIVRIGP